MRRLAATLALDVKVQARSQLYTIGVCVALAFGLMLRFLVPTEHAGRGLAAFYLLGLGGTTAMYGASMLLLEKGERTLEALRTSMITTQDYVASKVLTLTGFALLESLIIYALAARGVPTNHALLLLGLVVLGALYTLVGLGLASAYDSVTAFLLPVGACVGMVMQLPFLSLVDVGPWWLWWTIPTQAPLYLMQAAFEPLSAGEWAYALGVSAASLAGAWWFCRWRFRAHIRFPER